ncbi:MAG: hypothetical protein IM597_18285 [Pseudanabaena sp. M176S2SP2A07QC]|nr:hypothetical protein [Pseudanabaena sp. M172S2SP2A07QC]MCA6521035.1 hypothetical protein [Pseudanabaena sp. M051S1SP2A07QC]MCA6524998.1 hypothetical protein [Pseudanabaena sp. M179S2SP2A07QC]MCA6536048.1 hypothetical protein [Pseudanabaena sp. M176S2SP2A07QC]MCA6538147.1 hypothetical protein [Pseudanabaena sp. M037S2SP2A07QC]MCA6566183.1 hypothetical protein [Pseudanabaena sp. M151S2SP2A07QC]MCA6577230.1 hypothetical protein [Pseudanabaena sp. M085S1SP2A07QC]
MVELRSAIFWVLNCPIYLLRCYRTNQNPKQKWRREAPPLLFWVLTDIPHFLTYLQTS